MKLENGFGCVYKVKGKRRKPYRVYVTTGWDINHKQIKKSLGYVKSYPEGIDLLNQYHKQPYNLDYKKITFSEIWLNVRKELESLINDKKMTPENLEGLDNAYENHLMELHDVEIMTLKKKKMQDIIDSATQVKHPELELGYTGKGYMITVCQKVFNCAIDEYELPIKNYSLGLTAGEKPKSTKHVPYTPEELSILWGMQYNDLVKCILIFCYTGLRPNELFKTERTKIFLEKNYFITGSKTEAGKDRIIPIHPKIKHLIKYFYDNGNDYPFIAVFDKFNYNKLSREHTKLMKMLNFKHTPYDARHTFTTKMKKANVNEYIIKTIVGHAIKDLTEDVYTHRDIEELYNAVCMIN